MSMPMRNPMANPMPIPMPNPSLKASLNTVFFLGVDAEHVTRSLLFVAIFGTSFTQLVRLLCVLRST